MKKIWLIADLVAAVVVALLVDVVFPKTFTSAQQYFLGVLIFLALVCAEGLTVSEEALAVNLRLEQLRTQDLKVWEARNGLDQQLQEVRRLFHELEERKRTEVDLFYHYELKKLAELEASLRDCCSKQQLQIDETMFSVTTWLFNSAFLGRDTDILRAVLPTDSADFFFDLHPQQYFHAMYKLISNGRAKGVRRLIVLDSDRALDDLRIQRLAAFHNAEDKFACKAIDRSHFDRIMRDYKLHHLVKDFGIYGDAYLYKGLTTSQAEIVGVYSKDPAEIANFTQCFEDCWNAAKRIKPTIDVPRQPAVDWVFAAGRRARYRRTPEGDGPQGSSEDDSSAGTPDPRQQTGSGAG